MVARIISPSGRNIINIIGYHKTDKTATIDLDYIFRKQYNRS